MRATPLQDAFTSVWAPPAPLTPMHYAPQQSQYAGAAPASQPQTQTPGQSTVNRTVRVMDAESTRQFIREELSALADRRTAGSPVAPDYAHPPSPATVIAAPAAAPAPAPAPVSTPAPTFSWTAVGFVVGLLLAVIAVVLLAILVSNTIGIKAIMTLHSVKNASIANIRGRSRRGRR